MSKGCTMEPFTLNLEGKAVKSKLYKDILDTLGGEKYRETAKEWYKVGTDGEFLEKVKDKARFDENGEITLHSLIKLAKLDVSDEKLLARLNSEINSGVYSYEEAIKKISNFNLNHEYNDKFLATITPDRDKCRVSIVPNTRSNFAELERTIECRNVRDRILYLLGKHGIAVDFAEHDDKYGGRYSTLNAEKMADGLYHLIRIINGEEVTPTLAEEAGHFVVASLKDATLVQRLTKILTPEVQKQILGDEYNTKAMGVNGSREVAGVLVGKALLNEIDKETAWNRLAYRVSYLAKRVFYTITGNDVQKNVIEAKAMAREAARGFTSGGQNDIQLALETREVLYSADSNINTATYRQVVANLEVAAARIRDLSKEGLFEDIKSILGAVESGKSVLINKEPNSDQAKALALQGIAEAINEIADIIGPGKLINNILDSMDFLNILDFKNSMAENGRKLREARVAIDMCKSLTEFVLQSADLVRGDENRIHLEGGVEIKIGKYVDVNGILKDLGGALTDVEGDLVAKERQYFLKFLEEVLGSDYVFRSSRIVWNIGRNRVENKEGRTTMLRHIKGGDIKLSQLLDHLDNDTDLFERFLGSMSNNPDIIGQIIDKIVKENNKLSDDLTEEHFQALRILKQRFKDEVDNFKIEDLYERFDDGSLTGNIISELHWGRYEKEYKEEYDRLREEFRKNNPMITDLSEMEIGIRWAGFFSKNIKVWHSEHSTVVEETDANGVKKRRYIPNESYANKKFDEVKNKAKLHAWYKDYRSLKDSIDARLPEGATLSVRLPQFKGTFINIAMNDTSFIKGTGLAIRSKMTDLFCSSVEDSNEFGCDNNYNSEEEELYHNAVAFEKEKLNRLPLYGVNKLKNMTELSTDIFGSTLAYTSMANTYLCLSQIVNALEVGKTVLGERTVEGITKEKNYEKRHSVFNPKGSYAMGRYIKFLDKQVYGIGSSKTVIGKHDIILEKVVAAATRTASAYFLGGNLAGGIVNAGTGFNEIFKEALSAEYFNLHDFTVANGIYLAYLTPNMLEFGNQLKANKLDQFIRHFNVTGDTRDKYRHWGTTFEKRASNVLEQAFWMPYKAGDHYMQTMSYLAMATKIKLYSGGSNEPISLWRAYEKVENVDEKTGASKGKKLELGEVYFKSLEDKAEYYKVQEILKLLEESNVMGLSDEQLEYLKSKGKEFDISNVALTIKSLKDLSEKLTWNVEDESAFMDKCREINNRLHGIYNNQDKTAFHGNWMGRAMLAMKGYALGMLERRYSGSHYSVALGKETEGSVVTLAKVFAAGLLSNKDVVQRDLVKTDGEFDKITELRALEALYVMLLPWGKAPQRILSRAGFMEGSAANLRRNWGDLLMIGWWWILRKLTALPDDADEDDKNNIRMGLLYYFSSRLYREQAAFNIPTEMIIEWQTTLADLNPTFISGIWDIIKTIWTGVMTLNADPEDPKDEKYFYKSSKEGFYEKGDPKVIQTIYGKIPYWRSRRVFLDPYGATASYDYGRALKKR